MDKPPPLVKGRKIAVLVADGVATEEVQAIVGALTSAGHVPELVGPIAGAVIDAAGNTLSVNRAAPNALSVVYDAAVALSGASPALMAMTLAHRFLNETFRHGKPISVAVDAAPLLDVIGVAEGSGVTVGERALIPASLLKNLAHHRFPRRVSNLTPP